MNNKQLTTMNKRYMKTSIKQAIDTLVTALKTDEGYRLSWKANIAMAFKDEYARNVESYGDLCIKDAVHNISNQAAENFLAMLCNI